MQGALFAPPLRRGADSPAQDVLPKDDPAYDDIFLLRHLLSHPAVDTAAECVRFTVAYRLDPVNAFYLAKVARGERVGADGAIRAMGLAVASIHRKPALDGGPVQLVRNGIIDMVPMLDEFSHDEMVLFANMQKEEMWLLCDRATRATGRLVKATIINDFHGMPFRMPPRAWMKAFGESSKLAEKMYPQLMETMVVLNAPSWFSMLMKVVRIFMSKKMLDKVCSLCVCCVLCVHELSRCACARPTPCPVTLARARTCAPSWASKTSRSSSAASSRALKAAWRGSPTQCSSTVVSRRKSWPPSALSWWRDAAPTPRSWQNGSNNTGKRTESLFLVHSVDCHRLGQVAGLVGVDALEQTEVVRNQLERDDGHKPRQQPVGGHTNDLVHVTVAARHRESTRSTRAHHTRHSRCHFVRVCDGDHVGPARVHHGGH